MSKNRFLVLGTDLRQNYLARFLEEKGHVAIRATRFSDEKCDAVLLPLSETNQYMEQIYKRIHEEKVIFGCNLDKKWTGFCERAGLRFVDYMKVEGIACLNAVATAEGAIAEALQQGGSTIYGSRCLVTGYGRCGSVLAGRLTALGATVTVLERRKEKRARARCFVAAAYDFDQVPSAVLSRQDYVFNTVPSKVVHSRMIDRMDGHVTILDLASKPGGVDFEHCRKKNINAKLCPGLPGVYAPKSSARILIEVIENEM